MIRDSGDISFLGMTISRTWTFGAALLIWLCWSSLLVAAQNAPTDPVEVKALRDIKNSLIDINNNLSNWRRGDPCTSNWTGVLCFNKTEEDGYQHVRELQLLNMNLSGTLSPSLGRLSYMEILDFMWNNITGSIPPEIGNITSLVLLLLNGNQLTGPLPEELGYLPNLERIQIDQNNISGPIPKSFANLNKTQHFHMNNNSISGQIPAELSRLPSLLHFLLDNNNLSGTLPPELSDFPNLLILQLDNNNFDGSTIPASYGNMTKLLKLSLRNCSLQGPMPDLSGIPNLGYLDLSFNQLAGLIPTNKLSENITTIDLSYNNLNGTIPANFSELPLLQQLSIANNSLSGSVPLTIWQTRANGTEGLDLDFENNTLSNISGSTSLPQNVTLRLKGNPVCSNSSIVQFCESRNSDMNNQSSTESNATCFTQSCPAPYEYSPTSPISCFCAAPLIFGYRLKSPGFSNFIPYRNRFESYLTSGLELSLYQLDLASVVWESGPRLKMHLKLFPVYVNGTSSNTFNTSEARRIISMFTGWKISDSEIFGPYELLYITLLDPYRDVIVTSQKSNKISTGALVGIVLGAIAGAVTLSAVVSLLILRRRLRDYTAISKRRRQSKASLKIEGVKDFSYAEMAMATNNFNSSSQVGQGGYGKVYKGILADGRTVAIKRTEEGSLQGEKEFLTEIELLSRLHHRNLVSLLGYCDEQGEQMLVYEFMPNGTLRDHLSVKGKEPLSFATRLKIAMTSAKGILYLHTEADPPIFHRDIKASNILVDSRYDAKVADFGLSRLAPVPDIEGSVPDHISTVVKGTPGYLDPEYFLTHKLTDKSDVYSLGVVFLELLTGKQPISHGKNIVREVKIAYQSGMIFSIIDERMGSYPSDCIDKFLTLAMKCCNEETDARPSMADVVRELEGIWHMMSESDTTTTDTISTDNRKEMTPPSSSSMIMNPCVSSEVSGSDLVSGAVPTITPR
ncbi:probable LRR receptor-like serine/threonine-protein kinase At1g06840 [Populus nigra]|uniref:probable LRR receptor-like serine/threonine-protein kinase At1g06840 n=1 Tax=Populus nigra TaxID=3691 RepID=UPI002B27BE2A|nr:probable LRR receptor-like serine/threonine-protein kinase At1g06840 [Populus nigra]XP_061943558.1 probable LRR receptor-like serine/threonine-protein kinase At1g06840 [Populus nigra]XP_061943559.1 probable LRR receptor-like serine/threonine-protein kinase At1g06840 [Populus nigra]XP_061943560.1 probable LRR receptor-like serine/threonine-protein kinase At1g06840 [Populus nigra]XP_061943561.1 probable LRR receptor-like serine/threonine-protein kinase At1g06840 [Populus nigra]